ncbi:MAG TPA: PDR/VanB family oxidoreductase [Bordetella sp.]
MRLDAIRYGARNINLYHFVPVSGGPLPAAEPGAHIDLRIGEGLTRQYSLINAGDAPGEYVIAVQKDERGRGGSKAFHTASIVGEEYLISPPRNHFALTSRGSPTFLFAGGIGITPLFNMYRSLKRDGHPVTLYYWARTAADFLFYDELRAAEDVHLIATDPDPARVALLNDVIPAIADDAHLYCCGPAGMLAAFDAACAGRRGELIHQERFAAKDIAPGTGTFEVRLARFGKTIVVDPDTSILQACLEAGADVSYSCEEGVCGACEVRVLAGKVVHNDTVRSASAHDAEGTMMICCSRAAGASLTLDV